jgi:iron complex outermembrane receptor protein
MKTQQTALLYSVAAIALCASGPGWAQTAPASPDTAPASVPEQTPQAEDDQVTAVDEIVVVGSQIRGARTTGALPVTVVSAEQIAASGAVSGDDLFRSVPQMGDVAFNQSATPATSNAARGDVNSINLRNLGVGNTLVLLNGRRLVQHPTSQAGEAQIPVLGYNSNAIPIAGIERLEVLRDGAAAIYGADAVAGVVNTVLQSNFDGVRMDVQYGGAEGTHLREFTTNLFAGKNFERGNLSVFVNYTDRQSQLASDQDYTATHDLRGFFADDPNFATNLTVDRRTIQTPWANLATPAANGILRQGATALTTAAGAFHIQPTAIAGCATQLASGICLGSGALAFTGATRELRYDTAVGTTVSPSVERVNVFLTGSWDLNANVKAFGELGWYQADSHMVQAPVLNLNTITVPTSNYYNPFGPVTFANGQANPSRLPGLINVPVTGLPVTLTNYRFVDAGLQEIDVKNYQARALAGLRGDWAGWDWETALLYSEAQATDSSDAIDSTKLQAQLALSTPDAYNPFSGGCTTTTSYGDCTPSSQAAIDAIKFKLKRESRTTLTLADIKFSRPDFLSLWAGDVGVAFGAEARHETQSDDRDANIDGTIVFRDSVTGVVTPTNATAVSQTPDTKGERDVYSAYVEFAVPLVSPEMNIPLVHSLDLQIAGRAEHYSDFGDIAKPKIAAAWDIVEGLRIRGSFSEGFRAPNLEQVNATEYARAGSNNDYIRCEADLRANRIANFSACSRTGSYSNLISGNPDLQPEESTNTSYGIVFQPQFIPAGFGDFTFTVDRWKIEQTGVVGQFGQVNALVLDYLLRTQGSSNPNVIRAAPTADDVTLFAGTNIAPAGRVTGIRDQFVNLLPQTVSGVDFGMAWKIRNTAWGDFSVNLDAAYLDEFSRATPDAVATLFAARAAGTINAATPLTDASDLKRQNGRPEWRFSGSVTWSQGPFQVGAFTQYVSSVEESAFLGLDNTAHIVDAQLTGNLYAQYEFEQDAGWASQTRVRVGARNITNEQPPLSSGGVNSGAYLGSIYNPYGRYWYASISKSF